MGSLAPVAGVLAALVVAGLGVPLPEDLTLLGAGYLAWLGAAPLWAMLVVGLVGIVLGDTTLYWLGRHFGQRITRHPRLSHHLTPARLERVERYFKRHGKKTIALARVATGARAAFYLSAGAMHMSFPSFLAMDALAAAVSTTVWVLLGWHFGAHIDRVRHVLRSVEHWVAVGIAVLLIAWYVARATRRRVEGPREPGLSKPRAPEPRAPA
jgi:membrane protein DedA with SNARE-associated domain